MALKSPRIAPLNLDDLTDEQITVLGDRNDPRCELNFFKVMIQHPDLLKNYTPFAMQLGRTPTLPFRDKEILILRTLTLCQEEYELAHHHLIARQAAGLTDDEFEAARSGKGLDAADQVLARTAEELVGNQCISDETWAALAERYSQGQLIELVFMVANYTLLSMVNNSLGIQPEHNVEETWKPTDK
ncbi:carboxymuconolactone decarboxylase family protein [Emcibacter nanhaiensis]|nr:carboxymuconolactone decarboxylase family protein [Emcibacter nanhaiensis]